MLLLICKCTFIDGFVGNRKPYNSDTLLMVLLGIGNPTIVIAGNTSNNEPGKNRQIWEVYLQNQLTLQRQIKLI